MTCKILFQNSVQHRVKVWNPQWQPFNLKIIYSNVAKVPPKHTLLHWGLRPCTNMFSAPYKYVYCPLAGAAQVQPPTSILACYSVTFSVRLYFYVLHLHLKHIIFIFLNTYPLFMVLSFFCCCHFNVMKCSGFLQGKGRKLEIKKIPLNYCVYIHIILAFNKSLHNILN